MRLIFTLLLLNATMLFAQKADTSYSIDLKYNPNMLENDDNLLENQKLRAEFVLNSQFPAKYAIEVVSDTISILSKLEDGRWKTYDTIKQMFIFVYQNNELLIPSFEVMDFNQDGNQDLVCWTGTNVNGNHWEVIYLYDPAKKSMEKLENTAEGGVIWDDPHYDSTDSTIHCTRVASVTGLSFESSYKLKENIATPLEKRESDRTQMDEKGGDIERYYVGKNGEWELKEETINKE